MNISSTRPRGFQKKDPAKNKFIHREVIDQPGYYSESTTIQFTSGAYYKPSSMLYRGVVGAATGAAAFLTGSGALTGAAVSGGSAAILGASMGKEVASWDDDSMGSLAKGAAIGGAGLGAVGAASGAAKGALTLAIGTALGGHPLAYVAVGAALGVAGMM